MSKYDTKELIYKIKQLEKENKGLKEEVTQLDELIDILNESGLEYDKELKQLKEKLDEQEKDNEQRSSSSSTINVERSTSTVSRTGLRTRNRLSGRSIVPQKSIRPSIHKG